jgi:hypothetical protein
METIYFGTLFTGACEMVTIVCETDACPQKGIETNFVGFPDTVECGGCHEMLTPTDHREDPEMPQMVFADPPEVN